MTSPTTREILDQVALVAPGTGLRDGLDRIVAGRTGALVVLGENPVLTALCTGGFDIDAPFSATALRELAKMDGAIVLSTDLTRILKASVHLMPAASIHTTETGTRHRTADRVAKQTGLPVLTVSAAMARITLFTHGTRRVIEKPEQLMAHVNQSLAALGHYRARLDETLHRLSILEVQDQVTLRDLAQVAQRFEMLDRLVAELAAHTVELGADGRIVELQVTELVSGAAEASALIARDYANWEGLAFTDNQLHRLSPDELLDATLVLAMLQPTGSHDPDAAVRARGYRLLSQIPRLPTFLVDRLIEHFGSIQALFGVNTTELLAVDGVNLRLARTIYDGLARIADASYEK